jgi:hypothetical protein
MLEVAKSKWGKVLGDDAFEVASMQDLNDEKAFDGIIIRQAINYLKATELPAFFERCHKALHDGGTLAFNTFDSSNLQSGKTKEFRTEDGSSITLSLEGTLVKNGEVLHGHRAEIFDKDTGTYQRVYDLNRFSAVSLDEFEKGLRGAGFSDVRRIQEGKSAYFIATK